MNTLSVELTCPIVAGASPRLLDSLRFLLGQTDTLPPSTTVPSQTVRALHVWRHAVAASSTCSFRLSDSTAATGYVFEASVRADMATVWHSLFPLLRLLAEGCGYSGPVGFFQEDGYGRPVQIAFDDGRLLRSDVNGVLRDEEDLLGI
jgi:hypothetical protein